MQGYDVTGGFCARRQGVGEAGGCGGEEVLHILLGACGDIRNLLATLHAVMRGSRDGDRGEDSTASGAGVGEGGGGNTADSGPRMAFVVNDGSISMLARNAALLHMAIELGAPAEAVLDVWASHALSRPHSALLAKSLQALASKPWPAWLSAALSLDAAAAGGGFSPGGGTGAGEAQGQRAAEQELRQALGSWVECSMPVKELQARRDAIMGGGPLRAASVELSIKAAVAGQGQEAGAGAVVGSKKGTGLGGKAAGAGGKRAGGAGGKGVSAVPSQLRGEIESYIKSGSLVAGEVCNPTFLLAPQLQCEWHGRTNWGSLHLRNIYYGMFQAFLQHVITVLCMCGAH